MNARGAALGAAMFLALLALAAAVEEDQVFCCSPIPRPCCTRVVVAPAPVNTTATVETAVRALNQAAGDLANQAKPSSRQNRVQEEEERQLTRDQLNNEDAFRSDAMNKQFQTVRALHHQYLAQRQKDLKSRHRVEKAHGTVMKKVRRHVTKLRSVVAEEGNKTSSSALATKKAAVNHVKAVKELLSRLKTAQDLVHKAVQQSIDATEAEKQRTVAHRKKLNKELKKHVRNVDLKRRSFNANLLNKIGGTYEQRDQHRQALEEQKKKDLQGSPARHEQREKRKLQQDSKIDKQRVAADIKVVEEAKSKREKAREIRKEAFDWIVNLREQKLAGDEKFELALRNENAEKAKARRAFMLKIHQEVQAKAQIAAREKAKFTRKMAREEAGKQADQAEWKQKMTEERVEKRKSHDAARQKFADAHAAERATKQKWMKEFAKKKADMKKSDIAQQMAALRTRIAVDRERLRNRLILERHSKHEQRVTWDKQASEHKAQITAQIAQIRAAFDASLTKEAAEKASARAAAMKENELLQKQAANAQKQINIAIANINTLGDKALPENDLLKKTAAETSLAVKELDESPLNDAGNLAELGNAGVL